jgi:uncharacterized protein with von Willebrand factor type A (vWA) domain
VSSFIERLKDKMTGSLGKVVERAKIQKTRELVPINRFDKRVWGDARQTDPVDSVVTDLSLGDEHKGGERKPFDAAPELSQGLFFELYKAAPRLEDKRNLDRELYPARKILEEVSQHPELQKLQEMTAGDPVMSTIAFKVMSEELRSIVGRVPPPPPPPSPGGQRQGDGDGQGEDQPQPQGGGQNPGPDDENGEDAETPDFDPDSEDADNQAEAEWEQMYDDLLDDLDISRAVHRAVHKAAEEAEDLENVRKGIGLEDGEWQAMSPEERMAMAERLRTDQMRELAQVIGRTKRFALGVKASRVVDVPHEAFDVEMGRDLRHLLQSQYALLATPETTPEFYRRYVDGELLQFKLRGREEVGKGPIVVAIDKSGSMNGKPFVWAMGVAEALRRFAAEEDRDYYAMFFGNNNDRNRFDFPQGKGPFEKVLAFLSVAANGGTAFDGVLTEALDKASKSFDGADLSKADIVFITDGAAQLSEQWIAGFNTERERIGVRVYSIYINGGSDMAGRSGPEALLNKISDIVIPVKELTPGAVTDVFARV